MKNHNLHTQVTTTSTQQNRLQKSFTANNLRGFGLSALNLKTMVLTTVIATACTDLDECQNG